ncbi:glycosyltransferase, partial [Bacteroidota bacterium]
NINLILFDKNYGFAEGYNMALKKIESEYFILLNSDVEVTKNWIAPVINLMDYDKNIAACMPKIRSYHEKDYFEYAGAAGGYIDKYGYPFCRGRIIGNIEKDSGQYDNSTEIFWATGACMFIRADLFKKAGGFDPLFFAHMEEIDLCWRLKNMGYKIMFTPGSTVYHIGGGTLPNNSPQKIYLNFRNNLFLLLKNLPSEVVIRRLFSRMVLDGIAALVFLLTFRFSFFKAVLRAHKDFYYNIKSLSKRKNESISDIRPRLHKEMFKKSIIWEFYISKRKKFSNLKFKINQ